MVHTLNLQTDYGETIYGNAWLTSQRVLGNVIVIHGMAEHSMRYDRFAKFLNGVGYNVFAVDHPGHGKNVTAPKEPLRQYGEWPLNGFDLCVKQVHTLNRYIRSINNAKIIIFGHSMGSFIAQRYYQLHSEEIAGVILCGSSANNATLKLSRVVTAIARPFMSEKQRKKPAKFLANVQNKSFNKGTPEEFEDGYTSINRWISYNEDNVKAYDKDEGCGFVCSFNFYYSLAKGLQKTFKKKNVRAIKQTVPMLIISGAEDPVGGNGKYVKKLKNLYALFQENVYLGLYRGMKHELLNEDEYARVQNDIASFLTRAIK